MDETKYDVDFGQSVAFSFVRALEALEMCVPGAQIPDHCKVMGLNMFVDALVANEIISEGIHKDVWGYGDLKIKTGTGGLRRF